MNVVDVLIILLVIATVIRGVEIGLIRQAASLLGLIGGVFLGSTIASWIGGSALSQTITIVAVIIMTVLAFEILGAHLKIRISASHINHADKSLGAAMGVVTCLALVWLGSTLVSAIPERGIQESIRDSRVIAWLDKTLPPATDVLSQLEQSFSNIGLPELFGNIEPDLRPTDTTLPELSDFTNVVQTAKPSIVEIEGRSCQGIGVGSGFVATNNLIVTNAHVVAGMRTPYVRDDNGRRSASVVAFDPDLDMAILQTTNLAGEPLPITEAIAKTGTPGVVLGYPEGGPFVAKPARVVELFTALGKDIYNQSDSKKKIYALRADIQPGNSGGPLLDKNGNVIGVIFARSTAYEGVGYAVTTPEIIQLLEQAQSNPSAGSSLRCI